MHNKSTQTDQQPTTCDYRDQQVALLTQHGKEGVIVPVLAKLPGCRVEKVEGFDTDLLGTFTRDVARAGSQLDAARKKARIGMELSGHYIGIASESSFGTDPFTGMLPWNSELLIWIDDRLGIAIVATSAGKTNFSHRLVDTWEEAEDFARSAEFPEHHLVVRPADEKHPELRKGLADWVSLQDAVTWALNFAPNRRAFVETDMRAFANPTRLKTYDWLPGTSLRGLRHPQPTRRRQTFTAAFSASIRCGWNGSGNTLPPDFAVTAILNLTGAAHAFGYLLNTLAVGSTIHLLGDYRRDCISFDPPETA